MATKEKVYREWYNKNCSIYESCGQTAKSLINTLLDRANIPYHSINFRIKKESSFLNKCEKDKYEDPISQITDLCGIRIITYTNSDVERIQKVIEKEFSIDKDNSVDKITTMKDDQVGYLSVHYVVTFNEKRTSLEEYKIYKSLKFEIQIRTLLQHAWAEIEHDRNYKFSGELPREIKRRFYLVAGTLELLDREFQQISLDIDKYAKEVRESTKNGDLNNLIDSTSIMQYLNIVYNNKGNIKPTLNDRDKVIINELNSFGINTLADLDVLVKNSKLDVNKDKWNYLALLRAFMMIEDPDKYFQKAWKHHWRGMSNEHYLIIKSYNKKIENYLNENYIETIG